MSVYVITPVYVITAISKFHELQAPKRVRSYWFWINMSVYTRCVQKVSRIYIKTEMNNE